MEVGSLVECIRFHPDNFNGVKKGTRLTVRSIMICDCPKNCGTVLITFEEIEPQFHYISGREQGYLHTHFRQLLPRIDNIEEYINENIYQPY